MPNWYQENVAATRAGMAAECTATPERYGRAGRQLTTTYSQRKVRAATTRQTTSQPVRMARSTPSGAT